MTVTVTLLDAACVLIDFDGYRVLTDPVLDPPGRLYHHGFGAVSRKTGAAALPPGGLPPIDLVLLSHHQHQDNLDTAGRAFLKTVPRILSTIAASRALPETTGLEPWDVLSIPASRVPGLTVTATPAQHRPAWQPAWLSGLVVGFALTWDGAPGALWISGDTVWFPGLTEVGKRLKVDIALVHAGAAQFPYLFGPWRYTADARDVLRIDAAVNPRRLVPIHTGGWSHFREPAETLRTTLERDPRVGARTTFLTPGVPTLVS